MPVCAVRSEHNKNRNSSILCLLPVRSAHPGDDCCSSSAMPWLTARLMTGIRGHRDRLEVALAVAGFPAGLLLSNISTLGMLHGCQSATGGSHLSE